MAILYNPKKTYKGSIDLLVFCTLMCHVMLFAVFLANGATIMWLFNIFSVLTYLLCFVPSLKQNPWALYKVFYAEIMLHYLLTTFCVGNSFLFFIYVIMLIPMSHYCDYESDKKKKRFISPRVYIIAVFIAVVFGQLIGAMREPIYEIKYSQVVFLVSTLNIFISAFAITNVMSMFHEKIDYIEAHLTAENSELNLEAQTDALTELYNRRHADEILSSYIARGELFSIVLFDLDDFKVINDTYGHDCGDYVLKTVSRNITQSLRKTDVTCRWGGEEILVIMPRCDSDETKQRAENICRMLENYNFEYAARSFHVTITGGTAEFSAGDTALDLFNTADKNLYIGKKHGKNCIV